MATEAEAAVNALKKLESNKTCVNCGNYNRFGHQNICEKVRTFVCSNCKSAHQSFSMRVKSVSMSNWTMDEVDALREQNGGGNAVAARVWYGRWDENQMRKPTKDDSLDYYKHFINRVYNDKAFYDEDGYNGAAVPRSSTTKESSSGQTVSPTREMSDSSTKLLDFDTPLQMKASTEAFDALNDDGWGRFTAAPAPSTFSATSDVEFGAFTSAPPTTSTLSSNGCGEVSHTPSLSTNTEVFGEFESVPLASTSTFFDPFAGFTGNVLASNAPSSNDTTSREPFTPTNQSQQPTPNSMSQFKASPAVKDFSVFDKLSAPSPAYGTSQPNSNVYGQANASSGMKIHGHGQQQQRVMGMNTGLGMQHPCGGFQQQHQQHQQPIIGGNAGMNISAYFAPSATGEIGGMSNSRSNDRDPFAGLGRVG